MSAENEWMEKIMGELDLDHKAVYAALANWKKPSDVSEGLLDDLLIVQQAQERMNRRASVARRLATNEILWEGLEALETQDEMGAKILKMRFVDEETSLGTAQKMNLGEYQLRRRQRKAIDILTEIITSRELEARAEKGNRLRAGLMPPVYTRLFGVEERVDELVNLLGAPAEPYVIALVGMGGLGKTAVADAAVRRICEAVTFKDVVWLRMDGSYPSAAACAEAVRAGLVDRLCPGIDPQKQDEELHLRLNTEPYLIVIDNLESSDDTADLPTLLSDWTDPTKFLLTTRSKLPAGSAVHNIDLGQLPLAAATDLIHYQAQQVNLIGAGEPLPAGTAAQIYAGTGGNPLALKLVVGLWEVLPLDEVLDDLTAVQTDEVEQMYRRIYWQAWHSLSEDAQELLEMMPLAAVSGATIKQMKAMSALSLNALRPAIAELVNRSLLEIRGTVSERRYGIHQLTNSFLSTEIIHLPEPYE